MAQTSFGLRGRFWPTKRPLFHGARECSLFDLFSLDMVELHARPLPPQRPHFGANHFIAAAPSGGNFVLPRDANRARQIDRPTGPARMHPLYAVPAAGTKPKFPDRSPSRRAEMVEANSRCQRDSPHWLYGGLAPTADVRCWRASISGPGPSRPSGAGRSWM